MVSKSVNQSEKDLEKGGKRKKKGLKTTSCAVQYSDRFFPGTTVLQKQRAETLQTTWESRCGRHLISGCLWGFECFALLLKRSPSFLRGLPGKRQTTVAPQGKAVEQRGRDWL